MAYQVKEIYYTLQGEGANAGRAAVFCRFSGCNLWSGKEEDRKAASCKFCDTAFLGSDGPGGGRFKSANDLAEAIKKAWGAFDEASTNKPLVVFTGGEPLLQLDMALIDSLRQAKFEIAVETNGTISAPGGIGWICVSPKASAGLKLKEGDELKLVFPQDGAEPGQYENLNFKHFYLQPMDGENREENIKSAVEYCLKHPRWKLSLQTHKLLGIK